MFKECPLMILGMIQELFLNEHAVLLVSPLLKIFSFVFLSPLLFPHIFLKFKLNRSVFSII